MPDGALFSVCNAAVFGIVQASAAGSRHWVVGAGMACWASAQLPVCCAAHLSCFSSCLIWPPSLPPPQTNCP